MIEFIFCIFLFIISTNCATVPVRLDDTSRFYEAKLDGGKKHEISIFATPDEYFTYYILSNNDYESWGSVATEPSEYDSRANDTCSDVNFEHTAQGDHYIAIFRGVSSASSEVNFNIDIQSNIDFTYYWIYIGVGAGILVILCVGCCILVCACVLFCFIARIWLSSKKAKEFSKIKKKSKSGGNLRDKLKKLEKRKKRGDGPRPIIEGGQVRKRSNSVGSSPYRELGIGNNNYGMGNRNRRRNKELRQMELDFRRKKEELASRKRSNSTRERVSERVEVEMKREEDEIRKAIEESMKDQNAGNEDVQEVRNDPVSNDPSKYTEDNPPIVPPGWTSVWVAEEERYFFVNEQEGKATYEIPDGTIPTSELENSNIELPTISGNRAGFESPINADEVGLGVFDPNKSSSIHASVPSLINIEKREGGRGSIKYGDLNNELGDDDLSFLDNPSSSLGKEEKKEIDPNEVLENLEDELDIISSLENAYEESRNEELGIKKEDDDEDKDDGSWPLPEGWTKMFVEEEGRYFYMNEANGDATYDYPGKD